GVGRDLAEARPRLVEAREIEVALRAEVPVEDRLGDARLARDLGGRRTAVARPREDAAGGVEHRLPPCVRGQAVADLRHAASAIACSCDGCRCSIFRIASTATVAPARQSSDPTRSASWKP